MVCVVQGGEKYQQAFYVFEELAQAPATSSAQTLISQAVAELHLGRLEEAQAALDQALKKGPEYAADAIANQLVLNVISGKGAEEWLRYVRSLKFYTRCLFADTVAVLALFKRRMLSIPSWWTWPRRANCSTRRRQSTRPRWQHRRWEFLWSLIRVMISIQKEEAWG